MMQLEMGPLDMGDLTKESTVLRVYWVICKSLLLCINEHWVWCSPQAPLGVAPNNDNQKLKRNKQASPTDSPLCSHILWQCPQAGGDPTPARQSVPCSPPLYVLKGTSELVPLITAGNWGSTWDARENEPWISWMVPANFFFLLCCKHTKVASLERKRKTQCRASCLPKAAE